MTQKFKSLGLTLAVLLALGAVAASAASASTPRITVGGYPATITASQIGTNELVLEGGRKIECSTVSYSGTYTKAESEAATWSAKVTPSYSNCTAWILGNPTPATVTVNSCFIEFTVTNFVNATEGSGPAHLRCPTFAGVKQTVEIHVWTTSTKHLANSTPLCTYIVEEQTAGGPLNYKVDNGVNLPTEEHTYLTIKGAVTLMTERSSGGTIPNCGAATQTGTLTTEMKAEANTAGPVMQPITLDPS